MAKKEGSDKTRKRTLLIGLHALLFEVHRARTKPIAVSIPFSSAVKTSVRRGPYAPLTFTGSSNKQLMQMRTSRSILSQSWIARSHSFSLFCWPLQACYSRKAQSPRAHVRTVPRQLQCRLAIQPRTARSVTPRPATATEPIRCRAVRRPLALSRLPLERHSASRQQVTPRRHGFSTPTGLAAFFRRRHIGLPGLSLLFDLRRAQSPAGSPTCE